MGELNKRPESNQRVLDHVDRGAYLAGCLVRRAVDLLLLPYRVIIRKANLESGRSKRARYHANVPKIFSGLSRIKNRIALLENKLQNKRHSESSGKNNDVLSNALLDSLTSSDMETRQLALNSIGNIGVDEDVCMYIVEALHDPESRVRCAAATAAARINAEAAMFSLILLLDDDSPEVCRAAKEAIEDISGKRIAFDPSKDKATRKKKIESLKNWWKKERFAKLAKEVQQIANS
jgi:hypothetical protein